MVFGADCLGSMRSRREVFPEDQIQLIGIEPRIFDDLPNLESERQYRLVRVKKKVCVPFWTFEDWPKVCPARKQRPSGALEMKLTTLRAGDIARTRKKGGLNFLYLALSYVEVYWLLAVIAAVMFLGSFVLKRNEPRKGGHVAVH